MTALAILPGLGTLAFSSHSYTDEGPQPVWAAAHRPDALRGRPAPRRIP
jgi:hypothetical protein